MNVEIAEGLVIGPDDKLVVLLKDCGLSDEAFECFSDDLKQVLGERYIIIAGSDIEIAKVEAAGHVLGRDQ